MMPDPPSHDEIMRVRRWECTMNGHNYDVMQENGYDGPVGVVCTNCGAYWYVAKVGD